MAIVAAALAQKLIYDFLGPKFFVHPTLSPRTEGVSGGLSVRELRTQK